MKRSPMPRRSKPMARGTTSLARTPMPRRRTALAQQSTSSTSKRRQAKDRAWSKQVLARDRVCRWPGCDSNATDAHHIVTKAACPQLRHHLGNGAGLCRLHHNEVGNHPDLARDHGLYASCAEMHQRLGVEFAEHQENPNA